MLFLHPLHLAKKKSHNHTNKPNLKQELLSATVQELIDYASSDSV